MKNIHYYLEKDKESLHWLNLHRYSDFLESEFNINSGDFNIEEFPNIDYAMIPSLSWMCTDTMVGITVYRFRGEVVAIQSQTARKNTPQVSWKDVETYRKVKRYILSFVEDSSTPSTGIDDDLSDWEQHAREQQ